MPGNLFVASVANKGGTGKVLVTQCYIREASGQLRQYPAAAAPTQQANSKHHSELCCTEAVWSLLFSSDGAEL